MSKQSIKKYLARQLSITESSLGQRVYLDSGQLMPKRPIYSRIARYMQDFSNGQSKENRWIIISGLRGVGKTTLIYQLLINHRHWLISNNKKYHPFVYMSLDDIVYRLNSNLSQVLNTYEEILGCYFENLNRPLFLFLDEVQIDQTWAQTLKTIYDRSPNIFIICSGSSAIRLQLNADIAGRRALIEKLNPLSFVEYQLFRHGLQINSEISQQLINILYYSGEANSVYKQLRQFEPTAWQQWSLYDRCNLSHYTNYGNLTFALNLEESAHKRLSHLADSILSRDILETKDLGIKSVRTINKLLAFLAHSGDFIGLDKTASYLNISRSTLIHILEALVQAELIIKVPAYGKNVAATRKQSKYLFMSPTLRLMYGDAISFVESDSMKQGQLLEDLAALHYYKEFITKKSGQLTYPHSFRRQRSSDFILTMNNMDNIALEFSQGKKDHQQVLQTMKKYPCKYGLTFADSDLSLDVQQKAVVIPLYLFYLL